MIDEDGSACTVVLGKKVNYNLMPVIDFMPVISVYSYLFFYLL